MARAIWTGTLSFGLVSIPVRLFNATVAKDVRFHQFQAGTGRRIRYRRVAREAGGWPAWDADGGQEGGPEGGDWGGGVRPEDGPEAGGVTGEAAADVEGRSDRSGRAGAPPALEPEPPMWREAGGEEGVAEVPYGQVVKGFELDRDRYVMVTAQELDALAPEQTRTIEIEDFVDLSEIDPVYFEKSYYVAPQRGAEKPYSLLLRAMQDAGKVGIARFVLRTREYLAAIRPIPGAIALETLFYADEVRPLAEAGLPAGPSDVPDRELAMARRLVEFLATAWTPERYRDRYRERVLELIEAKAEGQDLVVEERVAPPPVPDLMEALRASVEAARARRSGAPRAEAGEG